MSVTFYFDRISRVSCVRTTSKAHSRCRTKVSLLYERLCTPLYVRIEVPLRNFRRSHNIIMMVMDDALKKWRRCRWFHRKKITWCHSRWGKCVTLKWQLNKWEFALNWKTSKKEMAFHHDDFWKKQHVWSIFPIFWAMVTVCVCPMHTMDLS